jgi:hypothetical protein
VNPETAGDRLNMLRDFGEVVTAHPAAGGPPFQFLAIFDQGPRRVTALELSDLADVQVVGEDTALLARAEDIKRLDQFARLTIGSDSTVWRVHSIERDEADGKLRSIQIVEGAT